MGLLIVTDFWPKIPNRISGIFVVQQVAALARAGCQITVIVPTTIGRTHGGLCSLEDLGLDTTRVSLIELPTIRLPEKLSSLPGVIWFNTVSCGLMLGKLVHHLAKRKTYDACIVHSIRYAGLSLPSWRHEIAGYSAIIMHGMDPFLANFDNQKLALPFIQKAGVASDAIVLVGSMLRKHAEAQGFPTEKVHVIANGSDLPPITTVTDTQHSLFERRRLVSVSNLVPLKGIDYNLRALAELANRSPRLDWEYRIIGDGHYRPVLEALAVELGIASRVQFMGRISYHDTMKQIAEADVFSLPSWGEAFGIVYLEAMARMRPVIGCFSNGAADIITDGRDGVLVPPQNVDALTIALERLLSDPQTCSVLGRAGRETAEKFSWDANASQMLALLAIKPGILQ